MSRADSKLVERAEARLAREELAEPDFEALATRIEGALAATGKTDDSLLLPPLPESVDDGYLAPAEAPTEAMASAVPAIEARSEREAASQREDTSLAELARAALARREAKDAVSLAKESLAIASQQRTAAPPTIEVADAVERERRTLPPAHPPARRARPALDTRGPWIGVAVAAVGLAAGFGLYLSGQNKTPEIVPVAVAEITPRTEPAEATKAAATNAVVAPQVTPDMLPAERGKPALGAAVLTPEALAREGAPVKATSSVAEARSAAVGERAVGTPSAPTGAGAPRAEKIVLEEDHAAVGAEARPSAPAPTKGLRPAELNANGGVADKPSTGAAQAAVGAVLGAARSCIAGQPQGSSATLVFGSSGEVTSVGVSGPAESTPAAACIQSALRKARVQPFAAASFSLGVTVRPP